MTRKLHTSIYILLALLTCGLSSCMNRMAVAIKPESVPNDVSQYTLLVEDYQYKDPKVFSPFIAVNTDSLKQIVKFNYAAEQLEKLQIPAEKEHPLIVETNNHLDQYNEEMQQMMSYYKFPYTTVSDSNLMALNYEMVENSESMIGGGDENTAVLSQYKYALVRKPVLHCYIDPNGVSQLSYRYLYYFQDLESGKTYPEIEVYSTDPNKTLEAIIYRLNKTQRPPKDMSASANISY